MQHAVVTTLSGGTCNYTGSRGEEQKLETRRFLYLSLRFPIRP